MRVNSAVLLISSLALIAPATASADFVHVVSPGESLASVAAADGLSVDQLAAANGLSPTAQLTTGSAIQIPPQGATTSASTTAQPTTTQAATTQSSTAGDGDGDSDDPAPGDGDSDSDDVAATSASPASPVNSATAPVGGGSYVVQPGDTLTAVAARAGESVAQLAASNGLDPNGVLLSGSVLNLSGGGSAVPVSDTTSSTASAASQPVGSVAQGSAVDPPYPTAQTVSPSQVGSIASANGVPPSLADAIAYQESGFNNDLVSSADARGVMQILPGTWQWIQHSLVPGSSPLAPASATDNVRGGVLMLKSLLNSTGGDPAMAAAGYYQGLPSVQQHGLYSDTQQYVNDVMSLAQRFGGG